MAIPEKNFYPMKVTDINIAEELSDLEKNLQKQREEDEFFQGIFIHKLKNGEQI
jgi:hypothetical protein